MIRITLMDDSLLEIPREEALELLPYCHVFTNQLLKAPVEGLLPYRGKLLPVLGPLPLSGYEANSVDDRPWILLMKGCAQVVRGLPQFEEAAMQNVIELKSQDQENLLEELDELLKSA